MSVPTFVALPDLAGRQALAWDALLRVAGSLGDGWTLVGGQMVVLHQLERQPAGPALPGSQLRFSYDVDMVVDLRTSRSRMGHIDTTLRSYGFEQQGMPVGHRYVHLDGTVFDVLAPDHLGRHLPRLGRGRTLQAAGGTQALKRTQWVEVRQKQRRVLVPRPDIVGAVLIKIAAAGGPATARGNRRHLQDVATLAALITSEDIASAVLTRKERSRIRRAADTLSREHGRAGLEAVASLRPLASPQTD